MVPIKSSGTLLFWSVLISRPFREPLCQVGVIGGPVAPPGVLEDVLAETGRLGELHVVTHDGQHGPWEVALQLLQDLGALSYPAVVERGDYALLQGPVLPVVLHLIDAADEVSDSLQRQRLHGDRDQELLDVEQAVDVEHVPRWRRVEQHEIVAFQAVQRLAQDQLRTHVAAGNDPLRAGERPTAGYNVQVLAGLDLHVGEAGPALQELSQPLAGL